VDEAQHGPLSGSSSTGDDVATGEFGSFDLLLSLAVPVEDETSDQVRRRVEVGKLGEMPTESEFAGAQEPTGRRVAVLDAPRPREVATAASRATHARRRRTSRLSIPLTAVLTIQTALSLRLIWSNTAFNDEALYLWAGHLELAHILHGAPVPAFQTYFSGAAVIYPPLGALADSLGGLAGARVLSLAFMLGATSLLYGATSALFGRRAGNIAAASFVALGTVQFVGAFATYDAMALFLMALAAWIVVKARGWPSEPLLIIGGIVLALADATKYPTALWDPVVIALAALTATEGSWLRSVARSARLAIYIGLPLAAGLRFGGHSYLQGVLFTTLARGHGNVPAVAVLRDSVVWIGIIFIIALRGLVIADSMRTRLLCGTMALAVVLAPLEQARIHTLTSLDKHVAFGAWFGAIAVGYVLAQAVDTSKYAGLRIPIGTVMFITVLGLVQSSGFYTEWPDSAKMVAAIASASSESPGPILAEQGAVVNYYMQAPPDVVTNTFGFVYWNAYERKEVRGNAAYEAAIRSHYFKIIEIDYSFPARLARDRLIVRTVKSTPGYRLVAEIPWRGAAFGRREFLVWRYQA
jgi:hypothetical protein